MARVNEHVWQDGKCLHCDLPPHLSEKACNWREGPPREIPVSVFNDLGTIGDRMKEIRAAEDIGLRGSAL